MPATLYYVERGDTLSRIAARFGTTVNEITEANLICNPNLIFIGEALIIPDPSTPLPRAGAYPYYIVRPGDTLWCLALRLGTTIETLASINNIRDPNLIYPGQELLLVGERFNPGELQEQWSNLSGWPSCDQIPPITIHGVYYNGSFLWEALGSRSIPYLLELLGHPCNIVRIYTVISLARIAMDSEVVQALEELENDPDPSVRNLIPLALRRIELGRQGLRNVHLTVNRVELLEEPNLQSPSVTLPGGTRVIALRWYIPSPTAEEGPRGGIQIYDRVLVVNTGRVGFIPRVGFDEIQLV